MPFSPLTRIMQDPQTSVHIEKGPRRGGVHPLLQQLTKESGQNATSY